MGSVNPLADVVTEPPMPTAPATYHTSVLLQKLIDEAPADTFTLDWLTGNMPGRSYGVVILFLALLTMIPIISFPARLMLLVIALQISAGHPHPALPKRYMLRPLSSNYLKQLQRYGIPMLKRLESSVRPRWPNVLQVTRRPGAMIAAVLIIISLVSPLPFANMPVAAIIFLMALAYIEHDGVLLLAAHAAALVFLAVLAVTIVAATKL